MEINFESFIEWDISPFILFSNEGKILYLNNAAEILFGYVSKQELYDITIAYAPQSFGYKRTYLTLSYDSFLFYAITVGYENEEQMLKKYKDIVSKKGQIMSFKTNIKVKDGDSFWAEFLQDTKQK